MCFDVTQKFLHLLSNKSVKSVDANGSVKCNKSIKTKLASVSLHCKSRGFKIANVASLSTNSMHRCWLRHFYISQQPVMNVSARFSAKNLQIKI